MSDRSAGRGTPGFRPNAAVGPGDPGIARVFGGLAPARRGKC